MMSRMDLVVWWVRRPACRSGHRHQDLVHRLASMQFTL